MEGDHHLHEEIMPPQNNYEALQSIPTRRKLTFLWVNVIFLLVGGVGSPLILRAYFLHGGHHRWFTSLIENVGFPILLIPLVFSFLRRRDSRAPITSLTPLLILNCAILGVISSMGDFLYSIGISYLPVTTTSILGSLELGFTAIFAFLMIRQKFTASSINSIVLLIFGAVMIGMHASGDRPKTETKGKYYLGFLMILGSTMIYGLVLPLVELVYKHVKKEVTYALVLEMQVAIGLSGTVFTSVGMVINNDFQAISEEAKQYGLGQEKYYLVIFSAAVMSQLYFIGLVGTIKYSTALLSGVVNAVCIPITEGLAVVFFHEQFYGEKVMAVMIALWGTASYLYGEYIDNKRSKAADVMETQLPVSIVTKPTTQ